MSRAAARVLSLGLLAVSLTLVSAGFASAQQPALRLKLEYIMVEPPQPVTTGERIEVVEFFWYGCPHCYRLQPSLEAWLKRKPADVELRRIPAIFRDSWAAHSRVYYTLDALGEVGRLHQAVYRALHEEQLALNTANTTADWAARNSIEPARWLTAYNSADVERKVQESRSYTKAYGVPGTPALVVDGRYLTSSGMSETMPGVITILDGLIAMARDRRAGK